MQSPQIILIDNMDEAIQDYKFTRNKTVLVWHQVVCGGQVNELESTVLKWHVPVPEGLTDRVAAQVDDQNNQNELTAQAKKR